MNESHSQALLMSDLTDNQEEAAFVLVLQNEEQ